MLANAALWCSPQLPEVHWSARLFVCCGSRIAAWLACLSPLISVGFITVEGQCGCICLCVNMYECLCVLSFIAHVHECPHIYSCVFGGVFTCVNVLVSLFLYPMCKWGSCVHEQECVFVCAEYYTKHNVSENKVYNTTFHRTTIHITIHNNVLDNKRTCQETSQCFRKYDV